MFEGAKGGSSKFKQTPDNLRSTDTFEGVLGLCAGPIVGPSNGLKSIKIDGTPIENETGELNFPDFAGVYADGDPLKFPQEVKLQLGAGGSPVPINVALRNEGGNNPVWVSRTLPNTGADFIDIRFIVNALYTQNKKGIFETNATIEIQMKPVGSSNWINPTIATPNADYIEQGQEGFDRVKYLIAQRNYGANGEWTNTNTNYNITGKTTGPAVYEARIAVPNDGAYANTSWDVRARLLQREDYSDSDGTNQEKRTISWESMSAVYSVRYGTHEDWRGLAWLQVTGKASDQLTGIPEITGVYKTKIMQVPPSTIFDPATRVYQPGVWDGSWTKAYTNDPAWVINDAIADSVSGLSLIAPGSYLNKWDALEVSKWCSVKVSDGAGGTHNRYSLNLAISDPQNAEEFIRYMAGAVGALAWDNGLGEWRMKIDKPETAVDIFTLDSIEDQFVYSHTDVDTRYNDIVGQFKNAEKEFAMDAVRLYDNVSIAALGRKPTTIPLIGCTNRQEAMRRVMLRLRGCANEKRVVNFTTNRRGRNIEPLAPILIADGDLDDSATRSQARIIGISADRKTLTLRDAIRLEAGVDYSIKITTRNGAYAPDSPTQPANSSFTSPTLVVSRAVANTSAQRGSVTTVYLATALPNNVAENADFSLDAVNLPSLPRMYRVVSVVPQDDGERVAISAINVDVDKWDAADNVTNADTVFVDLRGAVPPPTALSGRPLLQLVEVALEQGKQVNLQAVWVRPPSAFINGFDIRYRINGGAWQPSVRQPSAEWELVGPTVGTYEVEVRTVGRTGELSLPLSGIIDVNQQVLGAGDITYDGGETLEEMKPAQPGATEGMTDAEKVAAAQLAAALAQAQQQIDEIEGSIEGDFTQLHEEIDALNSSVSTVQGNITNLQSATSTIQQSVGTLQQDVASAQGTISSISIDLSTVQGNVTSLQSFASSAGSNLTTLNNSVSALQGQANSIQQSVNNVASDLGSAVGRITAAEGEVDALQTLTATQGGLISSNAIAISNVEGSLSALQTRVSAGRVNILEFGSFELGMVGWQNPGPYNWNFGYGFDWGSIALLVNPANGTYVLESKPFDIRAGNAYTISADTVLFADGGVVYVDMIYYDANGGVLLDGPQNPRQHGHNFSNNTADRGLVAVSSVAPTGAVKATARFVVSNVVNTQYAGVRQVKVENGYEWSAYTDEATVVNRATAIQTAEGQIASLTTRVGTAESSITTNATAITNAQGSIATLQTTVQSQGGSISTLQSSVTNLDGTVSTLSQTVQSQGASISTLSQTVSTQGGTLATLSTQVTAGGGNLLQNTDLSINTAGWNFNGNDGAVGDRVPNGDSWIIQGENGLRIKQENLNTGGFSEWDQYVAVRGNTWYDVTVLAAAHRCKVSLYIQFFDGNGNGIIAPETGQVSTGNGGWYIADWRFMSVKWQAPSNAVRARIILRKFSTNDGSNNSYAWFCRPQIAETLATTAQGLAYSPGSSRAVIETQQTAINTINGSMASLTTRVGTAEGNITTNATAISTTNSNLASLTTTVQSQGGSITTLTQSVTDLNGTVASHTQTINSHGSSISSNSTAITTLQGSVATLTNTITASSSPNLLQNGGFENGMDGWDRVGDGAANWYRNQWTWGNYAVNQPGAGNQGYIYLSSRGIGVAENNTYTVSGEAELRSNGNAYNYLSISWENSAGQYIGESNVNGPYQNQSFTADGSGRMKLTATSPGGAARARVRLITYVPNGVTVTLISWRQIKFEFGAIATPYSGEASASQTYTAYADLNSSYASLSQTVSSQGGSITTLQSSYSTLNGTVSSHTQTINTQGASIVSLQSATSTLQGDTATLKTQVSAGAGNLAPNTDFAINVSGWVAFHNGNGNYSSGRDALGTNWCPPNEHVFVLGQGDTHGGYYASFYMDQTVPVDGTKFYEWSGYLGMHRCTGNVMVQFFDSAGNHGWTNYGSYITPMNYDGHNIASYGRSVLKMKPPAGAVAARIVFEKGATQEGGNSYMVICRPQMKEVFETSVSPAAYSVGNAGAVISQQATVLSTLNSSFSSLESRVSSAEGSVTSLSQSLSSANGSISSLQGSVSSLNGSVSTLQQSSTTQAGQIGSLQSSVNTQGGQISTNAQAITTINGTLSQLNTTVTASSNPNLLPNGGFENGLRGWQGGGVSYQNWVQQIWVWGRWAQNSGFTGGAGGNFAYLETDTLYNVAGDGNAYTLSFDYDMQGGAGSQCYGEIVWYNGSGQYITQSGTPSGGPKSFDTTFNSRVKGTVIAPGGAAQARIRVVFYAPNGVNSGGLNIRQVKWEFGSTATPYSGEATAGQMYSAYSDLNSSHASLSTTVSSQGGSISSLQSTTSTLNGTVSSLSNTVSAQGTSITNLQSVQATQGGTISTIQQRVTIGGNLLQNTEFGVGNEGWDFYSHVGGNGGFAWGRDGAGDGWRPNGEHNLFINQQDSNSSRHAQWNSDHVNIVGGRWYEASIYAATHRCYCELRIEWYDANNNSLGTSDSPRSDSFPGFYQSNGGRAIGNYQRLWVKAQAPAGAARALLNWVKHGTSQDGAWNGAGDSWGWMVRPQLAEVYSDTSSPTAYFPGRTSASFSMQQTSINSLNSQYSSLSSTVSTQGSSISQQATSITNLQGAQATLSSTVQSQGSSISTLQTATSNLQGETATLRTQVTSGNPNLLRNGGFELGNLNFWGTAGATFNVYGGTDTWGTYAVNGNNIPDGGYAYIESNAVNIERDWYTLTCDVGYFVSGSGNTYLELIWRNSSDGYISTSGGPSINAGRNFTSDGSTRRDLKVSGYAPEGATRVQARIVWYKASGVAQSMHVRQVKLERGQNATPYTAEASARQSFETLNTLNGQYASLSSTVGTLNSTVNVQQTAINNLNGRTTAFWQVDAVAGGRAQLRVYADANGGGGVDITGDVRIFGNAVISGTLDVGALNYSRFIKRKTAVGSHSNAPVGTTMLASELLGTCPPLGTYSVFISGVVTHNGGKNTSTYNGKPLYTNYLADGGVYIRFLKNGANVGEYRWPTNGSNNSGGQNQPVYLSTGIEYEVLDSAEAPVYIQIYVVRGTTDTGIVNQGDYYQQDISCSYTGISINARAKWTFI